MIYTSYFANIKKLPKDCVPISISRFPPVGFKGICYKKLAPPSDMLLDYKNSSMAEKSYEEKYIECVLAKLNPKEVAGDLYCISGVMYDARKSHVVLCCFETPDEFCHRHIVAKWFCDAGITVEEYKNERKH